MTDSRIEAAARSIWMDMQDAGTEITFENASTVNRAMALSLARNALEAADAAAWRPIETAPRDGTQVILFRPKTDISARRITAGAWYEPAPVLIHMCPDMGEDDMPDAHWESWDGGFLANNPQPTHWQPLPAPPTTPEPTP